MIIFLSFFIIVTFSLFLIFIRGNFLFAREQRLSAVERAAAHNDARISPRVIYAKGIHEECYY